MVDPYLTARPREPVRDTVTRVLVTTGAADASGIGASIAWRLAVLLPSVSVHLVIGPWGSAEVPPGIEPVDGVDSLHDELARADLVVTAAGVTMLESLALGRPTVAVVTAANQQCAADGVARFGAAIIASIDDAPAKAAQLAGDANERARCADAGPVLIDGFGSRRVAETLLDAVHEAPPA
jgi:spore coat polysaccharide biosynthesis predicted glycosyltransferase SpsG